MINNEIITIQEEKKYISNITKLNSVKLVNCDSRNIHYKDVVDNKSIEFKMSLKKFNKENHRIKYYEERKEDNWSELIDGKEPWGGIYGHPKTEVDKLEITINEKLINMTMKIMYFIFM